LFLRVGAFPEPLQDAFVRKELIRPKPMPLAWAPMASAEASLRRSNDLRAAHRYNAACAAALAAAGQGEDATKLDNQERVRLRKQALDWLRADLTLRTKQLEGGPPADRAAAQQALRHW
jgi:hypothetical protein